MSEKRYTSPVITAKPEVSIQEVLTKMQQNFVKRIVITIEERPVGIVTERDIAKFLENDKTSRALNEIPVNHVMKKNIISLQDGLEDHFDQCTTRMDTFKVGSVVLVNEEDKIIGIVSKTDITRAYAAIFAGRFKVKDYMTEQLVTCRESDSLRYALNMINSNDISRLVVTDNDGMPIGIITTNTFLRHSSYFSKGTTRTRDYLLPTKKEEDLKVGDLVTKEILTVNLEDDLASAANIMIKNEISGVPVVNSDKNLVGVITKFDVVRAFSVVGINEKLKTTYKAVY